MYSHSTLSSLDLDHVVYVG